MIYPFVHDESTQIAVVSAQDYHIAVYRLTLRQWDRLIPGEELFAEPEDYAPLCTSCWTVYKAKVAKVFYAWYLVDGYHAVCPRHICDFEDTDIIIPLWKELDIVPKDKTFWQFWAVEYDDQGRGSLVRRQEYEARISLRPHH